MACLPAALSAAASAPEGKAALLKMAACAFGRKRRRSLAGAAQGSAVFQGSLQKRAAREERQDAGGAGKASLQSEASSV